MKSSVGIVMGAAVAFFLSAQVLVEANTKQIKAYKEVFSDEKPKCINCHTVEKPKKEGPHDLNDYGKKAKGLATASKKETPDAEIYKQAGQIEQK